MGVLHRTKSSGRENTVVSTILYVCVSRLNLIEICLKVRFVLISISLTLSCFFGANQDVQTNICYAICICSYENYSGEVKKRVAFYGISLDIT